MLYCALSTAFTILMVLVVSCQCDSRIPETRFVLSRNCKNAQNSKRKGRTFEFG